MNLFSFPPPLDSRPLWRRESSDTQGGLLLEAIVTLALLAVFLGFIFQKQLYQQKQLDEVNTAEAIKVVSDSVKQYVTANEALHPPGTTNTLTASSTAFAPFLPAGFNFDKFRAIVKNDAGNISALVVSDTTDFKGRPYSSTSAARIAAMIGSQGGLLKGTETMARGTMGLWDLDMGMYSVTPTANLDQVRIVSAVKFDQDPVADLSDEIEDLKGKVLFRVSMPSIPNANVMETDLTFKNGAVQTLKIGKDGSIKGTNFEVAANGNITAKNISAQAISGTSGTFSGALKAASGDFGSGTIVTTGGLKAGSVTATGQVNASSADFGSGTVKGGAISGTTGTFSGDVKSTAGIVRAAKVAAVGTTCAAGEIAASNDGYTLVCTNKTFSKLELGGASAAVSQCEAWVIYYHYYNNHYDNYYYNYPGHNCPFDAMPKLQSGTSQCFDYNTYSYYYNTAFYNYNSSSYYNSSSSTFTKACFAKAPNGWGVVNGGFGELSTCNTNISCYRLRVVYYRT